MPKSPERCQKIREEMRQKILQESMLYFAKNGFSGTKISDLAAYIGIGQGTIYVYFKSKEELFREIYSMISFVDDSKELKLLSMLPISAKQKIHQLTKALLGKLENDETFPCKVTLNTQIMFEQSNSESAHGSYQSELYQYTEKILRQGQKEGTVVQGDAMKLADYYWGVVYLYALKKLFTKEYEMISSEDLERTVLKNTSSE